MPNELSARAVDPEAPSEDVYQALHAALSATARGRAFLAEYARRQRAADTAVLMAAIERLEGLVRNQAPPPPEPTQASAEAMRAELHALLNEIRAGQKANDVGGLTVQVAQLAATIEQVERRLETIVAPADEPAFAADDTATPAPPVDDAPTEERAIDAAPGEPIVEAVSDATVEIEALPEPAEELTPAHDQAADNWTGDFAPSQAAAAGIPEVGWFSEQPARVRRSPPPSAPASGTAAALAISAVIETAAAMAAQEPERPAVTVFKAGTIPPPTPFAGEDFAQAEPAETAASPADPLAPIMALSEEERLALFT